MHKLPACTISIRELDNWPLVNKSGFAIAEEGVIKTNAPETIASNLREIIRPDPLLLNTAK